MRSQRVLAPINPFSVKIPKIWFFTLTQSRELWRKLWLRNSQIQVKLDTSWSVRFVTYTHTHTHTYIYIYICIYVYISSSCHAAGTDTLDSLSRHFSLSFIASGRSSGPHPVSSHSCWMYVRAGRPAFARPYVGVHRSTSLLLQQWPTCLVRLTWIVFVMGGRWPYSWCLVWCCSQHSCVIAV